MTEEIKFEKAIEHLEKIVQDLESGDISLDDALKRYEEGVKLSRLCQERLTQAEKKIEMLTRTLSGTFKKVSLDEAGVEDKETGSAPAEKKKRKVSGHEGESNEDLLL